MANISLGRDRTTRTKRPPGRAGSSACTRVPPTPLTAGFTPAAIDPTDRGPKASAHVIRVKCRLIWIVLAYLILPCCLVAYSGDTKQGEQARNLEHEIAACCGEISNFAT